MNKIIISILILSIGTLFLTIYFTKIKMGEVETSKIEDLKISKPFFAQTTVTNNLTQYDAGFGDEIDRISLNKLEIVDNRTALNGLKLFSEQDINDVKIKILPCSEMPLKLSLRNKERVLGNCFEINPGTTFEFSNMDYLIFPKKIFKGVSDYNFEHSSVYINKLSTDINNSTFYSGTWIKKSKKPSFLLDDNKKENDNHDIYFNANSYFNGYYYISFDDTENADKQIAKTEKQFGEKIADAFFKKNDKIFKSYGKKAILLKELSPDGFYVFSLNRYDPYLKDKNGVYTIKEIYKEPCENDNCAIDRIEIIKIKDLQGEFLSVYDSQKNIIKIGDFFYIINDLSIHETNINIYEVDINNPKFNNLLKNSYILSKNKVFNKQSNQLVSANAASFKSIGGDYFADKDNIYVYGRITKSGFKFDYNTVKAFESGLLKDKNGIYLGGSYISKLNNVDGNTLVDMKSFSVVGCKDRGCYFKDKNKIYYHWGNRGYFENFNADIETFEYLGNGISKDKDSLYQGNQIVEGVDIKSFEKIGQHIDATYFKDKNNYYKSVWTWIKRIDKQDVPFDKLKR